MSPRRTTITRTACPRRWLSITTPCRPCSTWSRSTATYAGGCRATSRLEHLGGAAYLFVRGMAGAATPVVDGKPYGVFTWRVPPALVTELSDLLGGRRSGRDGAVPAAELPRSLLLAPFVEAGVLEASSVQVAGVIARSVGGVEPEVLLGAALAARAPLFGHVCVVIETVAGSIVVDDAQAARDGLASLARSRPLGEGPGGKPRCGQPA